MSNIQAVKFALTPGDAEAIERLADDKGNMAWYWLAKSVKYSRNYLYAGLAITTIAVTGRNFAMIGPCSSKIVATLGIGLAAFSAKDLYDATSFLQSAVNIKRQPLETAIGRN
jgi:hypothetical protein